MHGVSLVPILHSPANAAGVKGATFSLLYPRCPQFDMLAEPEKWECLSVPNENISHMGYSVRTAEARYTEWRAWSGCRVPNWRGSMAGFENVNLVDDKRPVHQETRRQLAVLLRAQFEHSSGGCPKLEL